MVALLFPGQGVQAVGMGRAVAERYPAARELWREADEALGVDLSRIAWQGPEADLTATHNAQPAILVHSVAVFRLVARSLADIRFAAGHSLGEFSAYVAAGSLDFAEAVRTVRRRGELMYRSGEERPGAMAAVFGLEDDEVERVCREASAPGEECVAANYNAPGQVVISGDVSAVERATVLAREAGARRALPLNVSGAFHSRLMAAAEAELAAHLEAARLAAPRFPVVSNVTAEPVTDAAVARDLMLRQLTAPVRWAASMKTILSAGVDRFLELGPGSVLSGLLRRIDGSARTRTLGTASEIAAFIGT